MLSAGVSSNADTVISHELIVWADLIFVTERRQRSTIQARFRDSLGDRRIICLEIADRYRFMDGELVRLFEQRMEPFLP